MCRWLLSPRPRSSPSPILSDGATTGQAWMVSSGTKPAVVVLARHARPPDGPRPALSGTKCRPPSRSRCIITGQPSDDRKLDTSGRDVLDWAGSEKGMSKPPAAGWAAPARVGLACARGSRGCAKRRWLTTWTCRSLDIVSVSHFVRRASTASSLILPKALITGQVRRSIWMAAC